MLSGATPTDIGDFDFNLLDISDAGDPPVTSSTTVTPLTLGAVVDNSLDNAGERDVYTFDGVIGQRVYFDGLAGSGINTTLVSPSGLTKLFDQDSNVDSTPIELWESGSYSLIVQGGASSTGSYRFRLFDIAVDGQDISTPAFNATISDVLDIDEAQLFKFDASAGDVLDFHADSGCFYFCSNPPRWTVYDPANVQLADNDLRFGGSLQATSTGQYLVVLHNGSGFDYHFRPIDTSALTTESLTLGATTNGTIGEIGEVDLFTFAGTVGQRLYFDGESGFDMAAELVSPSGSSIFSVDTRYDSGPITLSEAGTYTLRMDGATGDYSFQLLDINQDGQDVAELLQNVPVSGDITDESVDIYRFAGTAGETIEFASSSGCQFASCPSPPTSTIYGPDDTVLITHDLRSGYSLTLPQTGQYVVVMANDDVSYDFRMLDRESTAATPIDINLPIVGELNTFAEIDLYSFAGSAGQRFLARNAAGANTHLALTASSGEVIWTSDIGANGMELVTLTESGQYVLEVTSTAMENYSFRFQDLALSDESLRRIGVNEYVNVTYDFEPKLFTFAAVAGDDLQFDSYFDNSCFGICGPPTWQLYDPANDILVSTNFINDQSFTASQTGQYVAIMSGGSRGSINAGFIDEFDSAFRIVREQKLSQPLSFADSYTGQLDAGDDIQFTFAGTTGQRLLYVPLRHEQSAGIQIAYGDGSGQFLDTDHRFTDDLPVDVVVADVDGDSSLDLVTANGHVGRLAVLSGEGTRQFSAASFIDVGTSPSSLGVGHFNQDANLDLAVLDGSGSVHLLTGGGDGTFTLATTQSVGIDPRGIVVADVNDDGNTDIVTTNFENPGAAGTITLLVGDGLGGLNSRQDFLVGDGPTGIASGYLNGDGDFYVVTANSGDGTISYRLANTSDSQGLAGTGEAVYTYDPTFNRMTSSVDELGRRTVYDIDPANGNIRSHTRIFGELDTSSSEDDDIVTSYTYLASGLIDTMTDPLGRITDYDYDQFERLTQVTYAVGTTDEAFETFEYDAAGNRSAQVDENGNRTEYEYDVLNRLVKIIKPDPDGPGPLNTPVVDVFYDEQGNPVRLVDALRNSLSQTYDALDRHISTTDAMGQVSRFTYDASDNRVSEVDRLGRQTRSTYDARNRLVDTTDPFGFREQFEYDADDNVVGFTDKNGNTTRLIYDERNRVTRHIDALQGVQVLAYDPINNIRGVTDEIGRATSYDYDEQNRLIAVIESDPDGSIGPLVAPVTRFVYDKEDNLIQMIDALGNVEHRVYDQRNRLVQLRQHDPDGAGPLVSPISNLTYDKGGRLTSSSDPLNRLIAYEYDGLDRLVRETRPDPDQSGPANSPVITYTYDAMDNELSMTDPLGNVTRYEYDNLYRQTKVIHEDPDGAAGPATHPITTFAYDPENQLLSTTDPLGRTSSLEYDLLGRVVRQTLPDPDGIGPLTSPVITHVFDAIGNRLSVTDALGNVTQYEYDSLSRLTRLTGADPDGPAGPDSNPVTTFLYDAADQLLSITDPLNRRINNVYDDLGRLITMILPDPDQAGPLTSPVMSYTYDAVDNELSMTDALGNVTQYEYDNLYRLIRMIEADPDREGSLDSPVRRYTYDVASQLLTTSDPLDRTTTYGYDDLGRIVLVTQPDPDGTSPLNSPQTSYSYDLVGNRLSMTDPLGHVTAYEYDNLYRLTRQIDEDLDGAGPLSNPVTTYDYNLAGKILSVTDADANTTTFEYDGLDRQVAETVDLGIEGSKTRSFVYDSMNNLLTHTDRNGRVIAYEYDNLYRNIAERWLDDQDNVVKTIEFDYDLGDQLARVEDTTGGSRYDYSYDDLGRVTQQRINSGGPAVVFDLAYNAGSLRTQVSATVDGTADFTNSYTYDHLLRLVRQDQQGEAGGAVVAAKRVDYTYNDASQFTSIVRYDDLLSLT